MGCSAERALNPVVSSISTWPTGRAPGCSTVPAGPAPWRRWRTDFNLERYKREKLGALEAFLADRQAHSESYIPGARPEPPLAELLRVCRQGLRIVPAHTITMPARVHPYVAP